MIVDLKSALNEVSPATMYFPTDPLRFPLDQRARTGVFLSPGSVLSLEDLAC